MWREWSAYGQDADLLPDRTTAGRAMADRLQDYGNRADVLVLGLPRGGVPVAHALATALNVPFDVFVVRKLGVPGHEELAFGALASGGVRVINDEIVDQVGLDPSTIERVTQQEHSELESRERLYRGTRPAPDLSGRVVILVDDGLATGSTMRAAIAAVRSQRPTSVIVAVPVAPAETCEQLLAEVDDVVCLRTPEPFHAVGLWYQDFSQTSDDEVRSLLEE